MVVTGRVSWFKIDRKFGFVAIDGGDDAFLHMSALKAAGYVSVPAGTTLQVRIEAEQGRRRVTEVIAVDVSTSRPGEPPPVLRKAAKNDPSRTSFGHGSADGLAQPLPEPEK